MQKKLLVILLTLCMLASAFPFAIFAEEAVLADVEVAAEEVASDVEDTLVPLSDTVTEIGTAAELAAYMGKAMSGNFKLAADIDLSEVTGQKPIASIKGTFDGDGHTISGINMSGTGNVGLFAQSLGATIKNLTIDGAVQGTSTNVAGLVGRVTPPLAVIDCTNSVDVTNTAKASANTNVGGFIGACVASSDSTISLTNCVNEGNITNGGARSGGLVGYFTISARLVNINIVNCKNTGAVAASQAAGGLVGNAQIMRSLAGSKFTMQDCVNEGAVTASIATAGGIVSVLLDVPAEANNVTVTLDNLYNKGAVTAPSNLGAINGLMRYQAAATFNFSNWMNASAAPIPMMATVDGTSPAFTVAQAYNATNGAEAPAWFISGNATVTLNNCANAASDADAFAALVAADEDAWMLDNGKPMLKKYYVPCAHANTTTETTPATCTDTGATVVTCNDCGVVVSTETIPALGHGEKTTATTVATCVKTGAIVETCTVCGATTSTTELEIDPTNHAGTALNIVNTADGGKYVYACCGADFGAVAANATVYVSTNGTTVDANSTDLTIGSEAKPFADFAQAFAAAAAYANVNGAATVKIVDTATVPTNYSTPAFAGTVTITGATSTSVLAVNNRFHQNGAVTVENVTFRTLSGHVWAAQNHKLVLGDGITRVGTDATYILGGFQNGSGNAPVAVNSDVTVRSGAWLTIVGANRQVAAVTDANVKLTIGATKESDTLAIDYVNPFSIMVNETTDTVTKKATVVVDGAVSVTAQIFAGENSTKAQPNTSYVIDYVLKQNASITGAPATGNVLANNSIAWTVYADQRSETAKAAAAAVVSETDTFIVTQSTYAAYCASKLGGHFGEGETCTECGTALGCDHAEDKLSEVVTRVPTCAVVGLKDIICECGVTVQADVEIAVDPDNHVDNSNYAWSYNSETGVYYVACSECKTGVITALEAGVEPSVYLKTTGNDENDGFTATTPVATLEEAVSRLAATGGKVVFTDLYVLSSTVDLPAWEGTITFTAPLNAGGTVDYGIRVTKDLIGLTLGGDAIFDALLVSGPSGATTSMRLCLAANWHDLDMRYIRVANKLNTFIIAGVYNAIEDDVAEATSVINIDGPALTGSAAARFYERVYLGSFPSTSAGNLDFTVSNKHVTLNVNDGLLMGTSTSATEVCDINQLFCMTTINHETSKAVTTENCTTVIHMNDNSTVAAFRSGAQNVLFDDSKGKLDHLEIYFNDNSRISGDAMLRNVADTKIVVSSAADGRTTALTKPFYFYKYGDFIANTEAKASITAGTHSFSDLDAYLVQVEDPDTAPYIETAPFVFTENITDECTWGDWEVTTEATPDSKGIETATCSVCGATKTREFDFVCTTHAYVAKADGTYYCANGCGTVAAPTAPVIIAAAPATVVDGEVTVNVSVKATEAILGACFVIDAPETLTLTSVTSVLGEAVEGAEGFTLTGATTVATPYKAALLNLAGEAATIDETVMTLTFAVDETAVEPIVVTIQAQEVYDADENAIETAAVSAEVALAAEVVAGDVTGEGDITIVDALLILKAVLNGTTLANADITDDGVLSLADVMRVLNNIAK